jgi:dual specificity MAP kinase phosphatase
VAGISRSPAIVISFLMRYAHMDMNDAYEFVKNKRSIVSPNLNFMGQLLQYEKKLKEQK